MRHDGAQGFEARLDLGLDLGEVGLREEDDLRLPRELGVEEAELLVDLGEVGGGVV